MSFFNEKAFNPDVFLKYKETVKDENVDRLIQAGVFVGDPDIVVSLSEEVGGNYITKPLKNHLKGDPDNYDGATDLTTDALGTYQQGMIVIGRGHGFKEKDFNYDITHNDFMGDVAKGLVKYWSHINQGLLISVLKGIFASALSSHIVAKTFSALSAGDIVDAFEVCGDMGDAFAVVCMHSHIAYKLQKAQLLDFIKYTDQAGMQRDTNLATWEGRLVIVDDGVNVATSYALTTDTEITAGKVYYTLSGSTYTKVANPVVSSIGSYYEKTNAYDCYVLGRDAFTYQDVGAKVPAEMARDASKNGGETVLYSRERIVIAPYGVSFKSGVISSKSPTSAELETGANWELCKDGSSNALPDKIIPIACLRVSETGI